MGSAHDVDDPSVQDGQHPGLDTFAGPGLYTGGYPGSPLLLLEALLSRPDLVAIGKPVHFIFVENDPDDFTALERVLDERYEALPPHITIARQRGKCQDFAEAMLKEAGRLRSRPAEVGSGSPAVGRRTDEA